jgi:hypothetical protein
MKFNSWTEMKTLQPLEGDNPMRKMMWVGMAMALLAVPVSAQTPDGVLVQWPIIEGMAPQSTALSGSETHNGLTITWAVGEDQTSVVMAGTYGDPISQPLIQLTWTEPGAHYPVHLVTDAQTATSYGYAFLFWENEAPNNDFVFFPVTQSVDYAQHFPGEVSLVFQLVLGQENAPYDLSATLEYGGETPQEPATFDGIKALYR